MTSHYLPEPDWNTADSVSSTPRSDNHNRWHDDAQQPRVRFMCSFGGRIVPRPHDNQLRYVGGDTRIVAVHRSTTFSALLSKLSKLSASTDFTVKYQLPNEDLDALISVTNDEDLDNMMEEYDRLSLSSSATAKTPRLRLFLFPQGPSRTSSISSMLDSSSSSTKHWFFDALNGGGHSSLQRGRSEVSSIVSEVPDYLFGLDNDSSDVASKAKNKTLGNGFPLENLSVKSDPGSPAHPVAPSPYCSTSSSTLMPPDLPSVKTKPDSAKNGSAGGGDQQAKESFAMEQQMPWSQQVTGYAPGGGGGNPLSVWQQQRYLPEQSHLQGEAVQSVSVYYLPTGNVPVRPMQMQMAPYLQGIAAPQLYRGHTAVMANNVGAPPAQVYGGQILRPGENRPTTAVEGYDIPQAAAAMVTTDGGQVLYGQMTPGLVPAYPPAAVPVGAEVHVINTDGKTG